MMCSSVSASRPQQSLENISYELLHFTFKTYLYLSMEANIFEIKCRINDPAKKHKQLLGLGASFKGVDHQIDTYFKVDIGRLKLREGNIENTLIRYHRTEVESIKQSQVIFQALPAETVFGIKSVLKDSNGIWKVVDKQRGIYFIDNIKFHIDQVEGLGDFMEIEAIDTDGSRNSSELEKQCSSYVQLLQLDSSRFIGKSYSDLIPSK